MYVTTSHTVAGAHLRCVLLGPGQVDAALGHAHGQLGGGRGRGGGRRLGGRGRGLEVWLHRDDLLLVPGSQWCFVPLTLTEDPGGGLIVRRKTGLGPLQSILIGFLCRTIRNGTFEYKIEIKEWINNQYYNVFECLKNMSQRPWVRFWNTKMSPSSCTYLGPSQVMTVIKIDIQNDSHRYLWVITST